MRSDLQYEPELRVLEKQVSTNYNTPGIPHTIWNAWPTTVSFPCKEIEKRWKSVKVQRSPADTGILFIREMKTGSSTLAGILLRLAHTKGEIMHRDKRPCRMRVDHSSARHMKYGNRNKQQSFLISLLRDPTKRAISHYFHFRVSQKKEDPTDDNFQSFFQDNREKFSNYYTKDLTTRPIHLNHEYYSKIIEDILKEYNFIAITERMNESLVVFKMLFDLSFEDILYTSAKTSGSFTTGPDQENSPCIYLVPSFLTDGMKDFFASEEWQQDYIGADNMLYNAANKSLDKTIDSLGRTEVERQVKIFEKALDYSNQQCVDKTFYRCNRKGQFIGQKASCYLWDIGCDHDCLSSISFRNDATILKS
eukprot:CAMPEP_0178928824 /NCGR_PEP_ID=MMETSP0786-20121207/20164_1 /TAXON_ID=186022 /ORGANISM="Thalassionema frauenfeldii, Strain CCMP 1798" /LENGTH=363 /DNA_ID=CAMNT_0020604823 /DNA_START=120 /DNA_END=1211 /DNA_ORIENTATION=-